MTTHWEIRKSRHYADWRVWQHALAVAITAHDSWADAVAYVNNRVLQAELDRDQCALDDGATHPDTRTLNRIRASLSSHTRPECDLHPDDDAVTCGWKSALLGVYAALEGEAL